MRGSTAEAVEKMEMGKDSSARKRKWYERYLPFVARSQQMQMEWLVASFRKGSLADSELTPYVRLLLEESREDRVLAELFQGLEEWVLTAMLQVADIYDTPKILRLIPLLTPAQARLALTKEPPPYEGAPEPVRHRVFQALHESSEVLLEQGAADLIRRGDISADFAKAYDRFREILMDEQILSSLYPKARLSEKP